MISAGDATHVARSACERLSSGPNHLERNGGSPNSVRPRPRVDDRAKSFIMGSSAADSSSTASSANRFFRPPIPRSAAHARLAPRPMGARSRWWTERLSHTQGTFTFQHQPPGMSATAADQYARESCAGVINQGAPQSTSKIGRHHHELAHRSHLAGLSGARCCRSRAAGRAR
jgi:hypothetical protein